MIDIRSGELADLLKQTAFNGNKQVEAISFALQQGIIEALDITETASTYAGIDNAPEHILDVMAIENNAPYYREDMSVDKKRKVIKNAFLWNIKSGTVGAMQELVNTIFGSSEVIEWFKYDNPKDSDRGTFYVKVRVLITREMIEYFLTTLDQIKNVRSHLRRILSELEADLDDPDPTEGHEKFIYKDIEILYFVRYYGEFDHSALEKISANPLKFMLGVDFWRTPAIHDGTYDHDGEIDHSNKREYGLALIIQNSVAIHTDNSANAKALIVRPRINNPRSTASAVIKYQMPFNFWRTPVMNGQYKHNDAISHGNKRAYGLRAALHTGSYITTSEDISGKVITKAPAVYFHNGQVLMNGTIKHSNTIKEETL